MGPSADHENASSTNQAIASSDSVAPTKSTSAKEKSSFFSRFALPLRSRKAPRTVVDFHIRPAEPHRKYAAGDRVQGAVVLTLVKAVEITHLTVALHGFVRVFKGPSAAANESINPAEAPAALSGSSRFKYSGNGLASLFQDEQVLSSRGVLAPGKYEYNFDLMFPSKGLPSSIDFERGTISYMITATLTRPTTISPTKSCERKIYLIEKLDVGLVTPPRPRTIYLEPIPKRGKKKKQPLRADRMGLESPSTPEPASDMGSTRANENSTEGSLSIVGEDQGHDQANMACPTSPTQCEIRSISGDSAVSGSSRDPNYSRNPDGSQIGGTSRSSVEQKTITATIELLKGGCLPGDTVSVKISVQHTKAIKSMHGVIATLYRQGRIDSAPPIAMFKELSAEEVKRLEKEEYYPKSRTGLGGLSLSSAGSCSVFRKDLSQAFSPLIIDPVTFTACVTTSVRIPEDAFPTIKGVPGEMIAFKYQLEVIVDLGGKLANQLQGGNSANARPGVAGGPVFAGNLNDKGTPSWVNSSVINTDQLRRQRGVISVVFELVVGTTDSSRTRGRAVSKTTSSTYTQQFPESDFQQVNGDEKSGWQNNWQNGTGLEDEVQDMNLLPPEEYTPMYDRYRSEPPQQYGYWDQPPEERTSAPEYIPPPNLPDDSELSEKERVRRAEERLLPSQPPDAAAAGSSRSPYLDGENIYDVDDGPSAPPQPLTSGPSHASAPAEVPSAPTLEDLAVGTGMNSTDDKQELERQRLLAEASVPPEFPDDYDSGAGPSAPSAPSLPDDAAIQPSAPVLSDEDEYGPSYAYSAMAGPSSVSQRPSAPSEPLPRYER